MAKQSIQRVAVLGAGVMGAQIAAHLANAGIPTILYDLIDESNPTAKAAAGIAGLKKLKPAPLGTPEIAGRIEVGHFEDLSRLAECDLVIEAIAERLDWKLALWENVAKHVKPEAILATNTSGLSIASIADALPASLRSRFCGVHFFNPPRYMPLVELIPIDATAGTMLDALESFLTTRLGKNIVRAKDTPNFIGNRIGVFSLLATMHHADAFSIPFEIVDALTGPLIGRPKSGTFRTADVVGLDTLVHVVKTLKDHLPDDPWAAYYELPSWLTALIEQGALGQKTRRGVYQKQGKDIHIFDVTSGDYRPATGKVDEDVKALCKLKDASERFAALKSSEHPQAQFLWAIFRDVFHYASVCCETIAGSVRDIDQAMRFGFAWAEGPFEQWQQGGWQTIAKLVADDIQAGQAMAKIPLPGWVEAQSQVYTAGGAYAPSQNQFVPRRPLSVYKRQVYQASMLAETFDEGVTLKETDNLRLWTRDDKVAIISFKTKMHTVSQGLITDLLAAIDLAEDTMEALVLWQRHGEAFSAGADLSEVMSELIDKEQALLEGVARFQQASLRLRDCRIPTVAAIRGLTLGGGCEFAMHCDKRVAAFETYMGLVEVGVGVIPAGGGTTLLARRAEQQADGTPCYPYLLKRFLTAAKGEVSASALDAKAFGLLQPTDTIVFHPEELLFVATTEARAMAEVGYVPPIQAPIKVLGNSGLANFLTLLANMREGAFVSDHDYTVASVLAHVICGGDVPEGTQVDEDYLLRLEREGFVTLCQHEKTRERMQHMFKTGKPLRN